MPEVMANAGEATLVNWLKATGDVVSVGDEIAEVETEKALVSVIAEEYGTMARILVEPGQKVNVGAIIAVLAISGDTDADVEFVLAGLPEGVSAEPGSVEPPEQIPETKSTRIFSSPIARKLAKDLGVELAVVDGTGPGGRIVRRDVETAARDQESCVVDTNPTLIAVNTAGLPDATETRRTSITLTTYVDIPHTPMRRAIARRLTESKSQVPHFYLMTECRVDDLLALRAQINASVTRNISINDLIVKAVAATLIEVPEANVTWSETALRSYSAADVSIAVATTGGLVTPVIRNADGRSLLNLSVEAAELAERGRNGRLRQDEIEGGSFSVTNLGMFGTLAFSAILNPPQSGILAVGAARQKPVVVEGEIVVATMMTCTLSADHRAIDGATAARWLAAFTKRIENPVSILV
jgi:pyruvate dehydrogenase E2 component (dihydrolipoamide acetyltransferase)